QVDAVIGQAPLREVVGADALRAVARADLQAPSFRTLARGLLALHVVETGAQDLHGAGPVLVLRLFRRHHHDAGRQVGDAHGRVGGVDVLAASTGRTHRVDADVFGFDLDVDLFRFRKHRDCCCGRMDATARLRLWHALDAVDARFELQVRENAFARHRGD